MRWLYVTAGMTLFCHASLAQTQPDIPKSGVDIHGQPVITAKDVSSALGTKADVTNGALVNPAIVGGTVDAAAIGGITPAQVNATSVNVGVPTAHTEVDSAGPWNVITNRMSSTGNDQGLFQSYYVVNHIGGSGTLLTNTSVGTNILTTPNNNVWTVFTNMNTYGLMNAWTQQADHVGVYHQQVRQALPAGTLISAASTGTTVNIASVSEFQYGYSAGYAQPISSGNPLPVLINGHSYNAIGVSGTSGAGTITLSSPLTGSDGALSNTVVPNLVGVRMEGMIVENHEFTDGPTSITGPNINTELDMAGNGPDDIDFRAFMSLDISRHNTSGSDYVVGNGIGVYGDAHAYVKRVLAVNTPFAQAVVDSRNGTQMTGAHAVWLASGQDIALSTDGTMNITRGGAGTIDFHIGGVAAQINGLSQVNAPGGFTTAAGTGQAFQALGGTIGNGQAGINLAAMTQASGGFAMLLPDNGLIGLKADGSRTLGFNTFNSHLEYKTPSGTAAYITDGGAMQLSADVVAGTSFHFAGNTLGSGVGGFDARGAIQGAGSHDFWTPSGGEFAWDSAGNITTSYQASSGLWQLANVGASKFTINPATGDVVGTGNATFTSGTGWFQSVLINQGLTVSGTSNLGNGSANYILAGGAPTGLQPTITATGSDANRGIRLTGHGSGGVIIGNGGVSTTAQGPFLLISMMAGHPSAVPTDDGFGVSVVYDTTNNQLCAYNGAWRCVTLN